MDDRIRAGIIPHADKKYCGKIRNKVLKKLSKDTEYIIYLATLHRINNSNKTYLIYKSSDFPEIKINLTPIDYQEHSYFWVEKELSYHFPKVKKLVIAPDKNSNLEKLSKQIIKFYRLYPKTVIIATTDLIHYGNQFDNLGSLMFPEQMNKILNEENLIYHLINKPIQTEKIRKILKDQPFLMCGHYAILLFSMIMRKLNWCGKVLDYYDSSSIEKNNLLDKYTITPYKIDKFVSYIGIIYGNKLIQNKLTRFDILMGIGLIKSNIVFNTLGLNNNNLRLPIWSSLYQHTQGVFVGTDTPNGKTNCCYGRFEDGTNTAIKIKNASNDCFNDANNRWKIPYQKNLLNQYLYKLELLELKKYWKLISPQDIYHKFKLDGTQGMYLTMESGNSATFLPLVARNNPSWNIDTYLNHLSVKAGGRNNDWKKGKILVYNSKEYTWNNLEQKLVKK